jgi:hypothetical protein
MKSYKNLKKITEQRGRTLGASVHKFSNNLDASSKFWATEIRRGASSVLRTHQY